MIAFHRPSIPPSCSCLPCRWNMVRFWPSNRRSATKSFSSPANSQLPVWLTRRTTGYPTHSSLTPPLPLPTPLLQLLLGVWPSPSRCHHPRPALRQRPTKKRNPAPPHRPRAGRRRCRSNSPALAFPLLGVHFRCSYSASTTTGQPTSRCSSRCRAPSPDAVVLAKCTIVPGSRQGLRSASRIQKPSTGTGRCPRSTTLYSANRHTRRQRLSSIDVRRRAAAAGFRRSTSLEWKSWHRHRRWRNYPTRCRTSSQVCSTPLRVTASQPTVLAHLCSTTVHRLVRIAEAAAAVLRRQSID